MMTTDELKDILRRTWNRELSADEAWELIDDDREQPLGYSREYWLLLSQPSMHLSSQEDKEKHGEVG